MQNKFNQDKLLIKVRLSMSRLLTIVNERKKLLKEYRLHLENQYIKNKQEEEKNVIEKETGQPVKEIKQILKERMDTKIKKA